MKLNFLSRPPSKRFNITHQPISAIDIIPASSLHGYIRIFSWLMKLATMLSNLGVILRILYSDKLINEETFERICKDTYGLILDHHPWANETPTPHKVLDHSVELMTRYNEGRGMKAFSEEGLESCNKHIRRYREMLARKTNFQDNIHDVFVRLLC